MSSCQTDPTKMLEIYKNKDSEDLILYHCGKPVMKVQQGTSFELTKMLYESTVGNGRIIGLKPRQKSPSLACIITQGPTILNEKEYDVILYTSDKYSEQLPESQSPNHVDKSVNTFLTFKPQFVYENQVSLPNCLPSESPTECYNDKNTEELPVKRTGNETYAVVSHDRNVDIRTLIANKNAYVVNWKCNETEKGSVDHKWGSIISSSVMNDHNEEEYEVYNPTHSQDSTSTGTIVSDTESPAPSSEGSIMCSPSQVYRPPFHRRQPPDEESAIDGSIPESGEHHSKKRRENKKWQCLLCLKGFMCRSALENHGRTHTGEKPFQCTHCGRCFSHQGNLKQHLHIHCEIKPHICNVCGKGFTRSNRLRDHALAHCTNNSDKNSNCKIRLETKVEWTPGTLQNPAPWRQRTGSEPVHSNDSVYNEVEEVLPVREGK